MSENSPTILVADDNPILLQGLSRALVAAGYRVHTVSSGAAIFPFLERAPALPDLLLLDVMMPGMTGLDVLRRLGEDPRWSALPVILITAASVEHLPLTAQQAGALELLIKPFPLAELIGRIEARVRRAREPRRAAPVLESVPAARVAVRALAEPGRES